MMYGITNEDLRRRAQASSNDNSQHGLSERGDRYHRSLIFEPVRSHIPATAAVASTVRNGQTAQTLAPFPAAPGRASAASSAISPPAFAELAPAALLRPLPALPSANNSGEVGPVALRRHAASLHAYARDLEAEGSTTGARRCEEVADRFYRYALVGATPHHLVHAVVMKLAFELMQDQELLPSYA